MEKKILNTNFVTFQKLKNLRADSNNLIEVLEITFYF